MTKISKRRAKDKARGCGRTTGAQQEVGLDLLLSDELKEALG